ncbi:MAG TPA: polyphenol oxidase family protein [Acidimicrobiales bacterium]|nr:polyphenol oxidase family protein [Acidimicrobiales bacterium]
MAAAPDRAGSAALGRLAGFAGRPVAWLHQLHGAGVVALAQGGSARGRGEDGDALVTSGPEALAIMTADCAPVALASPEGVVAAVHAGWRGLAAGVVQATVAQMRSMGATVIEAALGPCIRAGCYGFDGPELDQLTHRFGASIRSESPSGRPALDLPATVAAALDAAGASLVHDAGVCTACAEERFFSYRARGERQRQAMVVWKP